TLLAPPSSRIRTLLLKNGRRSPAGALSSASAGRGRGSGLGPGGRLGGADEVVQPPQHLGEFVHPALDPGTLAALHGALFGVGVAGVDERQQLGDLAAGWSCGVELLIAV